MILWIALFLLIVAISFVLAFQSMRNYQEPARVKPKEESALYLIRNLNNLNGKLLESLRGHISSAGLAVSIERLFKGRKAALTIFGPKRIIEKFKAELDLLELEDYTLGLSGEDLHMWEVGARNPKKHNLSGIFSKFPSLGEEDQFFWQIVLGAKNGREPVFASQIRAAVFSKDPVRRKQLAPLFQNLSEELVKIPQSFPPLQQLSFYKQRSLGKESFGPVLNPEKVIGLVRI